MAMAQREVVSILLRAGMPELAAKAEAELPDPVEMEEVQRFAQRYGLTRDWLISRMGGSP
jgi:hypothetical protein